jgi:hypothetical protein
LGTAVRTKKKSSAAIRICGEIEFCFSYTFQVADGKSPAQEIKKAKAGSASNCLNAQMFLRSTASRRSFRVSGFAAIRSYAIRHTVRPAKWPCRVTVATIQPGLAEDILRRH